MKPLKPFKPVTLQRNRFTWRVWWTIAVLACLFVLGLMLSLLVDGALDLAGHAVVSIWQPANEASAPAPALSPSAQPTVAPLPVWLSIVGAVFLFGLIWGTSLVLDDDEQAWGGHQATFWRTRHLRSLGRRHRGFAVLGHAWLVCAALGHVGRLGRWCVGPLGQVLGRKRLNWFLQYCAINPKN